jgi:pimeloyl-ACP methyl ester carboxylesterase
MAIHDRPEEKVDALTAPALVVRGANDPLVSPAWAESMTERLPQARLAVIDGVGHALNVNAPEHLGRLTLAFMHEQGLAHQDRTVHGPAW